MQHYEPLKVVPALCMRTGAAVGDNLKASRSVLWQRSRCCGGSNDVNSGGSNIELQLDAAGHLLQAGAFVIPSQGWCEIGFAKSVRTIRLNTFFLKTSVHYQ